MILEILKEQLRKGYELGGGEVCIIAASDLESFIAEIERLLVLNAELVELLERTLDYVDADTWVEFAYKVRAVIAKAKGGKMLGDDLPGAGGVERP